MTADDLDAAVRLSEAVSWPHTAHDWRVGFGLGRGVVAEENGATIGVMLWWPNGEHHATLGLAIVSDQHQRRGIGRLLIDATLEDAGDRAVSLCGTVEGLRLYERVGFVAHGTVHQHQGIVTASSGPAATGLVDGVDLDAAIDLDRAVDGTERSRLIRTIARDGELLGLERAGELAGWSLCRPFGRGVVIGPVVAASAEDAAALIRPWLERHTGEFVRVDTPSDSGLADLLRDAGLPQVGEVVAMTRGARPTTTGAVQRYALASQAFG